LTRKRFDQLNKAAKLGAISLILTAFVFLSDLVSQGGLPWLVFALFLGLAALMLPLIFCRCASCRRSLAWISAHKNFDDQPDPETLDTCPKCGGPFFDQPKLES
jgi:hypothetical protein